MTWLKSKLNKRVLVDARLTPDDWDLYTSEPEIERIAERLNIRFNECVNMQLTREETERNMHKEMRLYAAWGANDSEPHYVLEKILDEVYEQ